MSIFLAGLIEAVAAFADCSLNRAEAFNTPWLRRILCEIHLGATVAIAAYEVTKSQSESAQRKMAASITPLIKGLCRTPVNPDAENERVIQAATLLVTAVRTIPLSDALNEFKKIDFLKIIASLWKYSETISKRALGGDVNKSQLYIYKSTTNFLDLLHDLVNPTQSLTSLADDHFRWRHAVVVAVR